MSSAPASKARQAAKGRAEAFLIMASGKWKREMTRLLRFPNAANPAIVGSHRPVLKKLADKVMDPATTKAQMEEIATLAQQAASSMNMQGVEQGLAALGSRSRPPSPPPTDMTLYKIPEGIMKKILLKEFYTTVESYLLNGNTMTVRKGTIGRSTENNVTSVEMINRNVELINSSTVLLKISKTDISKRDLKLKRVRIENAKAFGAYLLDAAYETFEDSMSSNVPEGDLKISLRFLQAVETHFRLNDTLSTTAQGLIENKFPSRRPPSPVGNPNNRSPSPVGNPDLLYNQYDELRKKIGSGMNWQKFHPEHALADERMNRLKQEVKAFRTEEEKVRRTLTTKTDKPLYKDLELGLRTLEAARVEAKKRKKAADDLANDLVNELAAAKVELQAKNVEIKSLREALANASSDQANVIQSKLDECEKEKGTLKTKLKKAKDALTTVQTDLGEERIESNNLKTLNETLREGYEALEKEKNELEERLKNASTDEEKADIKKKLTKCIERKVDLEEELTAANNAKAQAEAENEEKLKKVEEELQTYKDAVETGGLVEADDSNTEVQDYSVKEALENDGYKQIQSVYHDVGQLMFKNTGVGEARRGLRQEMLEQLQNFQEDHNNGVYYQISSKGYFGANATYGRVTKIFGGVEDDKIKVSYYDKVPNIGEDITKLYVAEGLWDDFTAIESKIEGYADDGMDKLPESYKKALKPEDLPQFIRYFSAEGVKAVYFLSDDDKKYYMVHSIYTKSTEETIDGDVGGGMTMDDDTKITDLYVDREEFKAFKKRKIVPEPEPDPFAGFRTDALGTDITLDDLDLDDLDLPVKVFYGEGRHPDPYWYRRIKTSQSPLLENVVKVEYEDLFGGRKGKQITDKIHWEKPKVKKKDFQQEAKNGNLDFWVRLTEGNDPKKLYNGKNALYDAFMAVDPNTAKDKEGNLDTFKAQDGRGPPEEGFKEYPYLVGGNEIVPIVIDTYVKVSEGREPYPSVFFEEVLSRYASEGTTYAILTPAPNKGVTKVPSYYENTNWEKQHSVLIDKYQSDRYNFKKVQYYGLEYNEFIRGALGRPRVEMTEGDAERYVPALPSIRIPHRHEL